MRRGTTPTLEFKTPFTVDQIDHGFITFSQRGAVVLDLITSDPQVRIRDNKILVTLTQEQTLAMTAISDAEAQIRLVLSTGKVTSSNIVVVPICRILKEGVI